MIGQVLKDGDGKIVGHFLTSKEYLELLEGYCTRPFSHQDHEEALRLIHSGEAEKVGKSTADVIEMLKQLEAECLAAGL